MTMWLPVFLQGLCYNNLAYLDQYYGRFNLMIVLGHLFNLKVGAYWGMDHSLTCLCIKMRISGLVV